MANGPIDLKYFKSIGFYCIAIFAMFPATTAMDINMD
jgi:hypothetical protein